MMLSVTGQKLLNDRIHLLTDHAEDDYRARDVEQCLEMLVQAGELMDYRTPLPVPAELPSHEKLTARFGQQLADLSFGFECLEGWNGRLYVMFEAVEKAQSEGRVPRDFRWRQIKEKFGQIRMYHPPSYPDFMQLADCIDHASATTCEICGQPGQLFTKGWYKVRCQEHRDD